MQHVGGRVRVLSRIIPYLAILLCMATVIVVVTARPPAVSIAVGGDSTSQLRYFDEPFINQFNPPEPATWPTAETPRRWSKSSWSISWPNAGNGWWISHIHVNTTPRPDENPAQIEFTTPHMSGVVIPNAIRHIQLLTHSRNDTPTVVARMTPLIIQGDNRDLGIVMTRIGITPLGHILRLQLIITLVVVFIIVGLTSRIFLGDTWWIGVIIGSVLVWQTTHTMAEWWLVHTHTVLASCILSLICLALPFISKRLNLHASLFGIVGIVGVAQLIIVNSPWLRSSDVLMHIRMLNQVLTGDVLFTAQLPCEAGGQIAPYPVISYVLAAPFALLSNERWWQLAVLQSGATIAHALAVFYGAHVLRQYRLSTYQLICWGGFAIASPFLLRAIHIGEISNAWAHALYLVAVMSWFDQQRDWRVRLLLSMLVILSHTGMTITYLATMATYVVWMWMRTRTFPHIPFLVVLVSTIICGFIYYSQFIPSVLQSPTIAGCPPNYALAIRFGAISNGWVWPLIIAGLCGFGLSTQPAFRTLIVIGCGATLIALTMLIFRDQTVRWALAFTPFVAMSASIWLHRLAQKSLSGKVMSISIVLFGIWLILYERWEQVVHYLHD